MRTIDSNEVNQVSGGTFGLLSALLGGWGRCNPAPKFCEPKAPAHPPVPPRKRGC